MRTSTPPHERRLGRVGGHVVSASGAGAVSAVVGAAVGAGALWAYNRFAAAPAPPSSEAPTDDESLTPTGAPFPDTPWERTDENTHDLRELAGGVAVITGGASGIGLGLAAAAVEHGLSAPPLPPPPHHHTRCLDLSPPQMW